MEAFADTQAFGQAVADAATSSQVPIVWLAGETDPIYFETAARMLNYDDLANNIFRWIGYREGAGKTANTGDPALSKAFNLFKAHPNIVNQPMVVLFDSDANKPEDNAGLVSVLSLPLNETNHIAKRGIENLLPTTVFTDDVYDERVEEKDYGNKTTIRELNKMRLCKKLCDEANSSQAAVFENFRPVLDRIRELLAPAPADGPTITAGPATGGSGGGQRPTGDGCGMVSSRPVD